MNTLVPQANQADSSGAASGDTESGSNGDGSATQWLNDYLLRANLLLTQRGGPGAPIEDLGALLARCCARQLVRAQSFALQWILTAAEQDQLVRIDVRSAMPWGEAALRL